MLFLLVGVFLTPFIWGTLPGFRYTDIPRANVMDSRLIGPILAYVPNASEIDLSQYIHTTPGFKVQVGTASKIPNLYLG